MDVLDGRTTASRRGCVGWKGDTGDGMGVLVGRMIATTRAHQGVSSNQKYRFIFFSRIGKLRTRNVFYLVLVALLVSVSVALGDGVGGGVGVVIR